MMRQRKLIVLDPGHGGDDPGAVGIGGLKEAEVNLLLAHMVKARVEASYRVLMTRTGDQTISLAYRCNLANTEEAELFVSLHCNASPNVLAHGTETYYLTQQAKPLAEAIHTGLVRLGLRDRGTKRNKFYVLRHTEMPAVLVEVAFVTSPEDAARLSSVDWLNMAADAIAEAIRGFMKEG